MDIGGAVKAMWQGEKVARKGWNGKGMWICIVPGTESAGPDELYGPQKPLAISNRGVTINPRIDMKAADGSIVVGWLASQTDILAEDWGIVE